MKLKKKNNIEKVFLYMYILSLNQLLELKTIFYYFFCVAKTLYILYKKKISYLQNYNTYIYKMWME